MAAFKTLQFLPEVFRTDTNRKFLNATVDQLVSEPNLVKVNGYIGRKLAPSYKATDSYISEPSTDRQNYQLEPSIVLKNSATDQIDFVTTYPDIVNKINFYGGLTNNHNRLFDNEYYSYSPRIDLDKFVNFAQYHWLENGPDSVLISASGVPLAQTFDVVYDSVSQSYKFLGYDDIANPTLTLARGGKYSFNVNDPGNNFYIQSKPGILGLTINSTNQSTQSVLGVSNNGQDSGSVVFSVPTVSAQVQWTSMIIAGTVDYATTLSYQSLQGCLVSELNSILGGIDGFTTFLDNITLIFINNEYIDDIFWNNTARIDENDVIYLDQNAVIPFNERTDIYQINTFEDSTGALRIYLTRKSLVLNEQKVRVIAGASNAGKEFYSRLSLFEEVPLITANLNSLYYQSGLIDNAVGRIQIVDPANSVIDPDFDIVGQVNYTSPTGIIFTNGLKVTFDASAGPLYADKTFYVEGVGTSIALVLVDDLICPELDNTLTPDYFTIKRDSLDLNGWTRSNRWFHVDVIKKTAEYNNTDLLLDQTHRAQRPIIEFDSNLQLINFGTAAKKPIDQLDDIVTNAYTQIQGAVCASPTELTVTVDGQLATFNTGTRIIFRNDENLSVRDKIYNFTVELTTEFPEPPVYRAYIQETTDTTILPGHTLIVTAGINGNKQWYFNGSTWNQTQQKTAVNQAPLFDVIDSNGISFADNSAYPGNTFEGTKLFSYKFGNGTNDPVLGIPLSYKNFVTQGDIQFENNFDLDTFDYLIGGGIVQTANVNSGLLQKNLDRTTSTRQNIWTINLDFSKQYQLYDFIYNGTTNLFPINILPNTSTITPNIKVVINNVPLASGNFAITTVVNKLAILINPEVLSINDVIFISIFNKTLSDSDSYYEVPLNLDINSLNTPLQILTLGQMRNHLITFKNNSLDITGAVPGDSNLRDVYYNNRGGSILQHSAPVVYSGLFLNHPTMNFIDSLRLASREYNQFKTKFLEAAANIEFDRTNVAAGVDAIMTTIHAVKNDSFPWYYSDMLPHGDNDRVSLPSYTVFDTSIRSYEITNIFQDTVISNKAVFVYLTRTLEGSTTTTLLIKGQDYYFSQTRAAIVIQDTFNLLFNDIINVVEYNNTDGSYIPETPTKMGMYPKYIPKIYVDNTYRTPIAVIQGHDGSIIPAFNDFRDQLLLELERRIYNNIKVEYDITLFNLNDYVPGKFRLLDYTFQEFNQLLSNNFLNWVGSNRVEFSTNDSFSASDSFTWNYRKFRDVINGENLPGSWRSIFRYFFDTDRPHTDPWEMLGFSEKPSYWDDRYGPAPYTGGNIVLWSDLESGYVHAGPRAGIDLRYSRPGLTSIIPVDDSGNLRSPSEFLVTDYNSANANTSFAVGDIGPTELAWRRSSEFPFAMQSALALAKPARYFSLLIDVKQYARNTTTGQFVNVFTGQHLNTNSVQVNGYTNDTGNTERSAGYINWIQDYIKNIGIADAPEVIKNNLSQLSVQLCYKMASYTDKRFIELLAEQVSPSSINDSIVVPDENYRIDLYKGAPLRKITYSAIIVERTQTGYTVSGYNTASPYFFIIPSQANNNFYTISVNGTSISIYKDFKSQKNTIPYGFEFNTKQQVVDFLVSYQRYLISQGFVFDDRDNELGSIKDWTLSAKEFLYWAAQGWKAGSLIVLSPVAETIKVFDQSATVDEINNTPTNSRVLDINYRPIRKNNFTIVRDSNLFTFKATNQQTIGLAEFSLVQFEHLLVLDNTTVFQDVIYVPETGNRQYRLKLVGVKTGAWNGSLELPGFIYSSSQVDAWQPGQDYLKGTIVTHKLRYYTASENIAAADQFQVSSWQQINANELRSGIINNMATNARQSLQFYDINDQPTDEKLQLFSNGLIGFRPRNYFTNLGIDVTTQSKFYQGLIKQAGTINAIAALKGAQFNNLTTQLDFYENWAVRVGEYGALDVNQFVELILPEATFDNNPGVFQLIDNTVTPQTDIAAYDISQVYKNSGAFLANLFRIESNLEPSQLKPLPVAGFVNRDDVDATIFNIQDYAAYSAIVSNIGPGYTIWTARDFENTWNVYRATSVPGLAFVIRYNVDARAEVTMSAPHGLNQNDLIALTNFDTRFDGIYQITSIIDDVKFFITIYQNLQELIDADTVLGTGLVYHLKSSKLSTPIDVINNIPNDGWINDDKIWVNNLDNLGNWGVYNKTEPWQYQDKIQLGISQYSGNDHFGRSISLSPDALYLYSGAPDSFSGKVSVYARNVSDEWENRGLVWGVNSALDSFGKVLASGYTNGNINYLAVSAPDSGSGQGVVYVYVNQTLVQILADSAGSANDQFGAALAMSDDGKYLYIGAPGADKVYCYALAPQRSELSQNIIADGVNNAFTLNNPVTDATDLVVTESLRSAEYLPGIDYIASGSTITFTNIPANFAQITITTRPYYYKLLNTLPVSGESDNGSNFGSAVVCSSNGATIAVGANNATVDGVSAAGKIYVYHRTVTEFVTDGVTGTYSCPDNFNTVFSVIFNGTELTNNLDYFIVGTNSIQFPTFATPPIGNRVTANTNQFILDQIILPEFAGTNGGEFGSHLTMCNTGCNIYVSSPAYKDANYRFGTVTRYVNIGRVYGTVTGSIVNPVVTPGDSIIINNRVVAFSGSSLATVVSNINAANIPGVTASIVDSRIKIHSDVIVAANKLDIVSGNTGTPLLDLGINEYKYVQVLQHPEVTGEIFGSAIKVDQNSGTLLISSDGGDSNIPLILDSMLTTPTVFDSTGTTFADFVADSGAVYVYNLMPNPYENVDNPSLFAYTQKLIGPVATGFNFGAAIDIRTDYVLVGVSNDYNLVTEGGSLYYYYNQNATSGWELSRYKEPRIDIGAITSAFIYNTVTQTTIDFFDYLDPVKGKLLGIVDQEIDYREEYDPASYNQSTTSNVIINPNFYWSDRQVGRTWWDLSAASFIDYEQDTLQYRVKNWASLFPGSQVRIYEWVESNFLPSQYVASVGDGVPRYVDDSAYTSVTVIDPITGIITQKYYYWVSDKTDVDVNVAKRTLSVKSLENYITNPKDQGIPYLALLSPNAAAVYNIADRLVGNDIAIQLDTSLTRNSNLMHTEWQLWQQNAIAESIPMRAILKLKDSLVGFDTNGLIVPDPALKLNDRLGILNTPRQSMILNRLNVLQNYIDTVNKIFSEYPILLITTPSKLYSEDPLPESGYDLQIASATELSYLDTSEFPNGYKVLVPSDSNFNGKWSIYNFNSVTDVFELFILQSYKTRLLWDSVDWYSDSFVPGKDITYIINRYSDTQALTLTTGDYVKVINGGQDSWALYEKLSDGTLSLIGAQNATVQISKRIYDVTTGPGFDSVVLDAIEFDPVPIREIQNIYDSIYQEILINQLSSKFNELFLAVVNLIFKEQQNPDWIFKTSFVDVYHQLRTLEQFPNYVRDNQIFYKEYINEVKPYRTQIKDYVPTYNRQDVATGDWTDFDLPSQYDSTEQKFISPNIDSNSYTDLFTTDTYVDWANYYKYKVTDFIIGNVGSNYTLPPNVEITGGGGSGATAVTTINLNTGKLTGIVVVTPGSGYTSTPNVVINGDGTGATVYPSLTNEYYTSNANLSYNLIRNINTTIKFDRFSYTSNLVVWQPNTAYVNTVITSGDTFLDPGNLYVSTGNIIVYNNETFIATNANVTTDSIFDFTRFNKIDSGNVLLNSTDRIFAYYAPQSGMPGKTYSQLMTGIQYPGVTVSGPVFTANAFTVTSNVISFNYTGLTVNSGNVDLVNFQNLGFEQDQSIRIEALVPFDFQNNGYFTIVNVDRDSMTLTGQPVETTHKLFLANTVTANVGDRVTQANNLGNAYVLQSVVNSSSLDVIYSVPAFAPASGNISINNVPTTVDIVEIVTGGNANVTISYLDLQSVLDSNIYSVFTDTALGIRSEDINIVGGAYVDTYSSHAPEELVPGRMYDAMEMRVFSNTSGNTETYGFRVFQPMSANIEYTRISANSTTTLSANLSITDDEILVADANRLPEPGIELGNPGVVFVNGERIHYYQRYDAAKMSTAMTWTANTSVPLDTLIALNSNVYLTTGNVYANANVYINSANIQLITLNSLRQIRRGVDGTGAANIILTGNTVSDSSQAQLIPYSSVFATTVNDNLRTADYVTYKLILTAPITANAGDFITQFSNANVRVLESVTNSQIVAVNLNSQPWQANLVTGVIYTNFNVNSQDATMTDLFFKSDGTKMYTIGSTTDSVYEYTLGTAWDVTTASNVAAVSVSQDPVPTGLFFRPDGTKMYMIGTTNDQVVEYTLSTPWQVNTASNVAASVTTTTGGTSENSPGALFFRPDGSSYYIIGAGTDRVKRYDMTTPWHVNTAAYYSQSVSLSTTETTSTGLFFHPAGLKMFIVGQSADIIREYDLGTAWDPTTVTLVANSSVLSGASPVPTGMFWKPDGTSVYVVDSTLNTVSEYQVIAPFVSGNTVSTRSNIVTSTGTTNTTANVVSFEPLGAITSGATVYVNQTILRSNIWEQFGDTLQNSTTVGAQFIKAEPGYTP